MNMHAFFYWIESILQHLLFENILKKMVENIKPSNDTRNIFFTFEILWEILFAKNIVNKTFLTK